MKNFIIILYSCFTSLHIAAQNNPQTSGVFYKIGLASTLSINEDYTIGEEDNGTLLEPSAYFITNTLGYRFDSKASIGLNIEFNWHSESGLFFAPIYINFRYNFIDDDDNVFARYSYGQLAALSPSFEKGKLYKIGLGVELFDEEMEDSALLGLEFNRKRFGFRNTEKLSSVSIFLEFNFN